MNAQQPSSQKLPSSPKLEIAGFEPASQVDWPGKLAAVVFLQGCPWKCGYCHNFEITDVDKPGIVAWEYVCEHLESRRGLIEGVVFTGGEPTRQTALLSAIKAVKEMGLEVGLHTNGAYPEKLEPLLPYLDWVGLDVKATSAKYLAVTSVAEDNVAPMASLRLLLGAHVPVQVRTTLDPLVLDEDDVLEIQREVGELGVTDFVVQRVRLDGTNPEYAKALSEYRSKAAHTANDILPMF